MCESVREIYFVEGLEVKSLTRLVYVEELNANADFAEVLSGVVRN